MQLIYRVGGFTDKKYLKVYTDKTSPNSLNTQLLIPDESFNILLHQNEPEDSVIYSSVTVQKTADGWSVQGNSKEQLYFKVYESIPNGNFTTIKVGDSQVNISKDFTRNEIKVPYGFVFTNIDAMSDFLVSYGDYLQNKGFIFDDVENNYVLNWDQMVNEFLYWNQQGWEQGTIISLNPNASKLKIERAGLIAAPVTGRRADEFVLDQNNQPIPKENLRWDRIENQFEITTLDENAISNQLKRLEIFKMKRNLDKVNIELNKLYKAAQDNLNLIPFIIKSVESKATLGEISDTLRKVYGEHS